MNRRDPLIYAQDPQLVASGLWPDRHVTQTPLWIAADGAQFAGAQVQRRVPNADIPAATGQVDAINGIGQMQASNGVRWLWFAQGRRIYRWYGPAAELILTFSSFTPYASSTTDPTLFDFTPWGDWMIINAADKGAFIFKPGTPNTVNPLAGGVAPQDAVGYFKKKNQLLAVGHGLNKRNVSFSDADDFDTSAGWTPTADNLAGSLTVEELATPCRAACHFGPAIAVFGENQLFSINWVGQPFYWGQSKLLDGIGATGKFAVCCDGRILYGMSRNGFWKSDGVQYSYIDEVILRDYLQARVNWSQASLICVRKNDITGCIEFSFPTGSFQFNTEAWAYDPRYGGFSKVPPFSAMDNRVLFDQPVQGTTTGPIQLVGTNTTGAGDLLLETKPMLMQAQAYQAALTTVHIGALMDEIELFVQAAKNVEFAYGVGETPDGEFNWSERQEVILDQITYHNDLGISGTYHKLRFVNTDVDWDLKLQGFVLFGAVEGYKREKS